MPQKLKTYTDESLIPTELKDFYANRNGVYEPQVEGVDSVAGVLAKNTELLGKVSGHATEIAGKDAEIQRLSGQLANASSATIPRGHVAVPKADADLLEKVKAHGTAEEVAAKLDEHKTLKAEVETTKLREHLGAVAEALGYEREPFIAASLKAENRPEFELADSSEKDAKGNPKKVVTAKVKDASGAITVKQGKEAIEAHADYKPFIPAFTATKQPDGTPLPGHGAGGGGGGDSLVDNFIKERDAAAAAKPSPFKAKAA